MTTSGMMSAHTVAHSLGIYRKWAWPGRSSALVASGQRNHLNASVRMPLSRDYTPLPGQNQSIYYASSPNAQLVLNDYPGILCPEPPVAYNSRVAVSAYRLGSWALYSCLGDTHFADGQQQQLSYCTHPGIWYPVPRPCEGTSCNVLSCQSTAWNFAVVAIVVLYSWHTCPSLLQLVAGRCPMLPTATSPLTPRPSPIL